jgi:glycosyltransferase involved in cell wall biosynthesis
MANRNEKPKVAIDTWPLGIRFRNHGIYVYTKNLLTSFRQMGVQHSVNVMPLVCSSVSNDANVYEAAPGFIPRQAGLLRFDRLWRFGGSCISAFQGRADVMFCPSGTVLPIKGLVPVVATIHDVTAVVMPSYSRKISAMLRFLLRSSAKYSHMLITDSICSKQDLVNIYGVPEFKISVVYLGFDKSNFNLESPDPDAQRKLFGKFAIHRPYIIHHGVLQPRKNLTRLIQAYRLLLERNRNLDLDLVLAGPSGWQYQELLTTANRTAGAKGQVIFTGALSDTDLALLIKGASLAVIPSLYEGFCLPMVESMACGIPTIAANSSCLPEVSGGVLRYFNPQSIDEMAACMQEALENEDLRKELSEKGLRRAGDFDWQRCAAETLSILARCARNGKR